MNSLRLDSSTEDKLVVEAAVAFMEGIDFNNFSDEDDQAADCLETESFEGHNNSSSSASISPQTAQKSSKKKKTRRTRKVTPGYSTEQGRRKKAEVLALRNEVQRLQEWLERIHQRNSKLKMSPGSSKRFIDNHQTKIQDATLAMTEFQRLQQSEKTNLQLKGIVSNQVKLNKSILAELRQVPELSKDNLALLDSPKVPQSLLQHDNTLVIVDQFSEMVSKLYLDCESVFPKQYMPSFGCSMQPKVDKYRGRMMEIVARAPVNCSMKKTSDILWEELSTVRIYPDKVYRYMTERGPDAVAKGFDMTLRSRRGTTAVNGLQFMKKYEELDRIVQVRAYKLLLPTQGVQLCGHAWTIISKSASDPLLECDVQFYLQFFLEFNSDFSAVDKDINYIQEIGLDTWSLMMRTYSIWLQELVVEKATITSK